ncbi:MAG: hypothetical protein ACLFUC_06970 [Bacteroidales bacterium]
MKKTEDITLAETLCYLLHKLSENTERIRVNNKLIKKFGKSADITATTIDNMNRCYEESLKMTRENNDFLEIFNCLNMLIHDHGDHIKSFIKEVADNNSKSRESVEIIFEKTINGEIHLNEYHPLIEDEDFIKRLLEYYSEGENFEKCDELMKRLRYIENQC